MAEVFVVDASVAAKWHLPDEEDMAVANLLLLRFAAGDLGLLAPDIFRHEVASAITVATRGRSPRLSVREGERAIASFLATAVEMRPGADLIPDAYNVVHQYGCALYDALYLALAQRLGLPFITADRKLHQRIGQLPDVVWLADYGTPPGRP